MTTVDDSVEMMVRLENIEMDQAIQCRSAISTETVNEYAERMVACDKFPPIELFGNGRYWIGDGWHRVYGAQQIGALEIHARVQSGNRLDALRHALGANARHGHRRSNADKRRAVEIAVREFSNMSSRAIAEMCGVDNGFVGKLREVLTNNTTTTTTGKDGKQYPAKGKKKKKPQTEKQNASDAKGRPAKLPPPSNGMQFARIAIINLKQITRDDTERDVAFSTVRSWLDENATQV